jgi:tetratricopeptide (TPR) repeat protein
MVFFAMPSGQTVTELLDSAKHAIMEQNYPKAIMFVRTANAQQPNNPEVLHLKCSIMQSEILDYEAYDMYGPAYLRSADSTLDRLYVLLPYQRSNDSLKCMFYIGSTLGGICVVKAKNGSPALAFKNGLSSVALFKKVLGKDSGFIAADFGLGVFNYYLSQNLHWLPFYGDKTKESLAQIHRATNAPFPFNYAACNSLCWILVERKEFAEADSIATAVLSKYPENTMFIRIKVRTTLGLNQLDKAEIFARKLIELSMKRQPVNWSDAVSGYQALVVAYERAGRFQECRETIARMYALHIPAPSSRIDVIKRHMHYIADVQKKHGWR